MSSEFKVDIKRDFKGIKCTGYSLSEKYDGVQGVWNGKKMLTRTGKPIKAPQWWLNYLPTVPLIGELWLGRNTFESMSGIARGHYEYEWRKVRYMVFKGCPEVLLDKPVFHVKRFNIKTEKQAHDIYKKILRSKGEGIMLSNPEFPCDEIKIKPVYDLDAKVIGHEEGKGRNKNRTGALSVQELDGTEFRVGSGLTDALRINPPPIGSIIKVSCTGRTKFGIPRFPRYIGIRAEEDFV